MTARSGVPAPDTDNLTASQRKKLKRGGRVLTAEEREAKRIAASKNGKGRQSRRRNGRNSGRNRGSS